ncbi:hypothetical protein GWK47_015388 [Chionoecetes opilio]|uniref:MADF domain-containing protein n=1 Tax=Chionoecetes opilio TaxID=41210 RepID=A0A8J4XSF1_CHIOP|nr:hypothetical protein GWK47_015388 [Chionoecetes opilio]
MAGALFNLFAGNMVCDINSDVHAKRKAGASTERVTRSQSDDKWRKLTADKSEAGNMADFDIKEEDIEIKEEAVEVKQENPETEESGSTARRGEKRVLSPSHSPETKKQRTEVEQVWIKEEAYEKGVSQESPMAIKMTTSFSWSTQATFTLLEKVRDREELWKAKHRGYNKKTLRRALFEEITKELKAEFPSLSELTTEDVIVRLIYLRGHSRKLLRKLEKTPSGSGGKVTPKWEYFEACSFLTPVYSNTTSASSVQPTSNTSEKIYEGTSPRLLEHFLLQRPCFHSHRVVLHSQLLTLNVATCDLPTLLEAAGVPPPPPSWQHAVIRLTCAFLRKTGQLQRW